MKITKNIDFNNFKNKVNQKSVYKNFKLLIKNKNEIINSLTPEYKYRYSKNLIKKLKKSYAGKWEDQYLNVQEKCVVLKKELNT